MFGRPGTFYQAVRLVIVYNAADKEPRSLYLYILCLIAAF